MKTRDKGGHIFQTIGIHCRLDRHIYTCQIAIVIHFYLVWYNIHIVTIELRVNCYQFVR